MHSEIWYAIGGWDPRHEEPLGGAVLLERCRTLREALDRMGDLEHLAPVEYGPGALVVLANDGERLAGPHTCLTLVAD